MSFRTRWSGRLKMKDVVIIEKGLFPGMDGNMKMRDKEKSGRRRR